MGRGWFGLEQNGIGTVYTWGAAGLFQELSINYDSQGYGYAGAYTQLGPSSAPVNHVTLIVRLD